MSGRGLRGVLGLLGPLVRLVRLISTEPGLIFGAGAGGFFPSSAAELIRGDGGPLGVLPGVLG